MDDLEQIFDRALHCQKMVDFGGEGWDKYAKELATIIAEFPARVVSYSREAVKDALDVIAQNEGWEDSRDYYAAKFGLPYKYVDRFHKPLEANHE